MTKRVRLAAEWDRLFEKVTSLRKIEQRPVQTAGLRNFLVAPRAPCCSGIRRRGSRRQAWRSNFISFFQSCSAVYRRLVACDAMPRSSKRQLRQPSAPRSSFVVLRRFVVLMIHELALASHGSEAEACLKNHSIVVALDYHSIRLTLIYLADWQCNRNL
jgi:hypothetical protein